MDGGTIRVLGAPRRISEYARASYESRAPLDAEVIHDALVPAARRVDIPFLDADSDWAFKGWKAGVYAKDRSVSAASLLDRHHTSVTVGYEPDELEAGEATYVAGDAVYGGLLARHFGHFLVESTNRLWWPLAEGFTGPIVFQSMGDKTVVPDFAARFFDLLGLRDRILVTGDRAYRFDRVIVPRRSFVVQKSWHRQFRLPFLRAGAAAEQRSPTQPSDDAGVFLSRAQYDYRRSRGEERLERAFVRNGFRVVYPEQLPLEQQIVIARTCHTVAGVQGSAFHSILFSEQPKEAVYICRDFEINKNFLMIDDLMGNKATHLYNSSARDAVTERLDRETISAAYKGDTALDMEKIFWMLERPGVFQKPWSRRGEAGTLGSHRR